MNARRVNVLLIEDSPGDARLVRELLREARRASFHLEHVDRLAAGLERLAGGGIDVVLLDLSLPDGQGLETFRRVRAEAPTVPIVVLSGLDDETLAVQAVQEGAQDYLVKGQVDGDALARCLRYAMERQRVEERLRFLAEAGQKLGESLDYETTLASVARLAVPFLGDGCVVDLVEESGAICQVAVAHVDPAKESLLQELGRRSRPETGDGYPAGEVLRTGRPLVHVEAAGHDRERLDPFAGLGIRSYLGVPLVARGRTLGVLSFIGDRSPRQYDPADLALAEELARRAALAVDNARLYREAQDALRARQAFLLTVSHDLGNPLTAIKTWAGVLRQQVESDPGRSLEVRGLRSLETAADEMGHLLRQILEAARLEAGHEPELALGEVDLWRLAERLVEQQRMTADRHWFELRGPGPGQVVGFWDAGRLEQIVSNLLSNAVKYSPAGGRIVVVVERDDGEARLSVKDEGLGIPRAAQAHLFEPFYRAANVTGGQGSARIPGLGLGLFGSQRLAQQHGGRIEVESEEGRGSTFTLVLPLRVPAAVV